ncbi:MAG: hydantoinase B/oxoprolinase family protein [Alphaproteobacteria bacterium]
MSAAQQNNKIGSGRASDGARMAVLSNRLEAIARRMQNTLFRTGRSGVLNTAHDFSCVILTADCRLLSAAESLPIHVMIGPDIMAREVKAHHPELKRGDAFLHNSPYHGNSHPADHCTIVPVIDDAGVHRLTVLAKAHQADCGNSEPTTYMGHARDVYEEGALIFPAVKVQEDYQTIEDIVRMCRMRIRVPDQWWGDYLAALGAARIGERELLKLGEDIGWETLEEYVENWFDYSEQRMIQAIGRLPSGTVTAISAHDPYPGVPDGIPTKVTVKVEAEAGSIRVDLRDNLDCQPCGLNLSEACSITAAMVGIFNGIKDHTVPPNAGSFRRVEVLLRENCVTGIPRHPHSCSVATTNLADRVSNPTQRALAELAEGFGMAEAGPIIPPTCGVISGRDPRRGNEIFVNQLVLGVTGGAGSPEADAWMPIVHVGNAGMCRQDSIEVDELSHPLHVKCRRLLADTEGAGTYRGAPSIEVEFGPSEDNSFRVLYVADGTINPAAGTRGGLPGGPIQIFKRSGNGDITPQAAYGDVELLPGETIISISSGGGGYGPPTAREVGSVKQDLDEGWVTRERAETVYGLALDAAGVVDMAATDARRRKIQSVASGGSDQR